MSQLVPFSFESHTIRVDRDDQNVVWFVAKDVADALDIAWKGSDTLSSIKAEWQGVRQLRTPGGEQELIVILEQAVYKLAFRSRKPEAERFSDWAADVIASIRKTGGYSIASPSPSLLPIETSIRVFTTAETFARNVLGLAGNFAKLSADLCVKKATGLSVLDYFGQSKLLANPKGQTYNPTELGALYTGGISARKINFVLELSGFQKNSCGRWTPTEKAAGYFEWVDTNKKSGGTPIKQLRWFASVLEAPDFVSCISSLIGPPKGAPIGIEIYS